MVKSKVKEVVSVKEWGQEPNVIQYHCLVMDNGDKINIGKKKVLAVGDELSYEIVDTSQEYNKAKNVMEQQKSFGKGKGSNGSFALSYAKDLVCNVQIGDFEEVTPQLLIDKTTAIADGFKKWLDENE